jgi:outer membrane protein assembly factor BamB
MSANQPNGKNPAALAVVAGAMVLLIVILVLVRAARVAPRSPEDSLASASGAKVTWRYRTDASVLSVALGADGTIYAGSLNQVSAIDPNGKLKWKRPIAGVPYLASGDDGTLYAASSAGFLLGFSDADGSVAWEPRLGLTGFGAPPALARGGTLLCANTLADLYAVPSSSPGSFLWSQSTFREGAIGMNDAMPGVARAWQQTRSSPAIWLDETITLPRQHWLHLFNPDGTPEWFIELTQGMLGLVALGDDGTAYVPDDRHTLFAVTRSGRLLWSVDTIQNVDGSPVVGQDGTIYITAGDSVYALGPDGSTKWQAKGPGGPMTPPTLAGDGTVYVGYPSGLLALHADGSVKWNLHGYAAAGPATIGRDGTIYYSCGYGWVCAVQGEGSPLMHSPWPKAFHDPADSSRMLTEF